MKHLKIVPAFILALLFLSACGGNKKQAEQAPDDFDIEDYIKAAESIDPSLNSVDQVIQIMNMVNAEYYDVLTNDPYTAHSYKFSYPVAAANLGIYMADILYHYYGEADEALFLSFAAAQELARFIGVESKFAEETIETLEGPMMQRDSLTLMFNNLMAESKKYNTEQEMVFVHTAFLAGSFIEQAYLTGNILKQKMAKEELTQEEEGDIRELLVIYLNILDPSTSVLSDAFERQEEHLSDLVVLTTFERLKELSAQLKNVKNSLAVAPVEEIASNEDLNTAFRLVDNLRNVLVNASPSS